ncbi:MAG TPA: AMP-binding protein [Casimicrobiaceae bacterium]|nr:AMP-binding protein [Casimicrobiaceae bacterium]
MESSAAFWNLVTRASEVYWTRRAGIAAVNAARRRRFDALVAHARAHSPLYRATYRSLPATGLSPADLPIVTKATLMANFDAWVTDPKVRLNDVVRFLGDHDHVGELYLDRYLVWKSSGSTGTPGIYVQDADAIATYDALVTAQVDNRGWDAQAVWRMVSEGGRAALIAATGDHFASIASWRRVCRAHPWRSARSFSVLEPLPRLVAELNTYQPAFVASYPTLLYLLAEEQDAKRLRIKPVALWSGGERLPAAMRASIESAFGCPVANEYGASECLSIAYGCREGWLHVNADWVLLEAVDRDYAPVPAGEASHTVLLTNLANRVQPLIRYDLGDSIVVKPRPCECGNPLPAIQVEGRCDDVISLRASDGRLARLPPMALTTIVEESAKVHRFQIVQDAPDRLQLRLEHGHERTAAWAAASAALRTYLAEAMLPNVEVMLSPDAPIPDPRTGKLREVIVLLQDGPGHPRPHG